MVSPAFHIRSQRRLIRIINPGESAHFFLTGPLIETLGISLLADCKGSIYINLNEIRDILTKFFTHCTIWRYRGHQNNDSVPGKQLGDKPDSTNVFIPVLLAKAKIAVQLFSDNIAVEHLYLEAVRH